MERERITGRDAAFALGAGLAVWAVTGIIAFVIYVSAATDAAGASAGVMAGAFLLIPLALGVTTAVSMFRGFRKDIRETQRKRAAAAAAERANRAKAVESARQGELARRERERADAIRNEERRQQQLVENLQQSVSLVVSYFNDLPVRLERAATARDEAKRHFEAGAYSPFWSSIEESLAHLSRFRSSVEAIGRSVNEYRTSSETLRARHDTQARVPELPRGLEVVVETSAAQSIAASVQSLTYEAQKDPVFAQIWEQRRTTAATIDGFASIEAALRGMSNQISSSVKALQGTMVGVGLVLASEIGASREAADGYAREAHQRAGEASELLSSAVAYLREADRREGGTGTALWDRGRF